MELLSEVLERSVQQVGQAAQQAAKRAEKEQTLRQRMRAVTFSLTRWHSRYIISFRVVFPQREPQSSVSFAPRSLASIPKMS